MEVSLQTKSEILNTLLCNLVIDVFFCDLCFNLDRKFVINVIIICTFLPLLLPLSNNCPVREFSRIAGLYPAEGIYVCLLTSVV
jgi:hypothetical protein